MDPKKLRSHGDVDLADKLLAERLVIDLNERLEKEQEKTPLGIRRHLLATSIRITERMLPDIFGLVAECRERLDIEISLEVYVYASTSFNAMCIKPEQGRLFILLSSSLLEAFAPGEQRFVIGHELGHHLFGHLDIPIGFLLGGDEPPPPDIALRLFAWSRYAEISADRAGAYCANDPDAVARALFRLASGLTINLDDIRIDDFAAQVDDMQVEAQEPGAKAPQADWFSTHPFSPLRLKAVRHFFDSELFVRDEIPVSTLEARVQTLMALMEPSYLDEKSDAAETARRLLFAGAIAVANVSGGIDEAEIAAFEKFFGEHSFTDKLDIEAIVASLDHRVSAALEQVSHSRRIQVLRDLCVIARADGHVDDSERILLEDLAGRLEVPAELVHATLCGNCDLD